MIDNTKEYIVCAAYKTIKDKTSTKGDSLNILNLPSCFRLND